MARIVIQKPYYRSNRYNIISEQDRVVSIQPSLRRAIQVAKNKVGAGHILYIAEIKRVVLKKVI